MRKMPGFVMLLVLIMICQTAQAEIVNWRLEFTHDEPKAIHVRFGGKHVVYHYMTYTIENKSGVDVDVDMQFFIATDSSRDYTDVLDPVAERAIIIREARLENRENISEAIQSLKDEKKYLNRSEITEKMPDKTVWHGVAIFPEIDRNMDRMILQVGGLASYIRQVKKEIKTVIEVFRIYYERKGDEFHVDEDPIVHRRHMDRWAIVKEFGQVRADLAGNEEVWVKTKRKR